MFKKILIAVAALATMGATVADAQPHRDRDGHHDRRGDRGRHDVRNDRHHGKASRQRYFHNGRYYNSRQRHNGAWIYR